MPACLRLHPAILCFQNSFCVDLSVSVRAFTSPTNPWTVAVCHACLHLGPLSGVSHSPVIEAVICSELYSLDSETSGGGGVLADCYTHSESENEQLSATVTLFFSFYTCFSVSGYVWTMSVWTYSDLIHLTGIIFFHSVWQAVSWLKSVTWTNVYASASPAVTNLHSLLNMHTENAENNNCEFRRT